MPADFVIPAFIFVNEKGMKLVKCIFRVFKDNH